MARWASTRLDKSNPNIALDWTWREVEPNLEEGEIPNKLNGNGEIVTNLLSILKAQRMNNNQEELPLLDP